MSKKKYISLNNLTSFLNNIKNIFTTKEEVEAKADKGHTHIISNISGLQSALDGKANSSHGTHVSFSTTSPLMDGTASVGSATTVARSDHRHPTDSSRASQTSLDSHTSNSTSHITATERTNWNTAYTHSQTAHAVADAEPNQNAFSNVKIGDVTIAADIKTDTLTLIAGDNVTITPDAANDAITISSKDTNTTYTAGTGISLSGTKFSNSGVRSVGTGSSNGTISVNTNGITTDVAVKGLGSAAYTASTAYDAAGTAKTKSDAALASAKAYTDTVKNDLLNGAGAAYDTLKELGDLININVDAIDALEIVAAGKADKSHTHDDRYYTETEIDNKLSGKANSSHGNHVPTTQTASNKVFLRNDNTWATITPANIGAAASNHNHTVSNITDLTVTATELNYMDGITSNVQAQLDSKAASSHSHTITASASDDDVVVLTGSNGSNKVTYSASHADSGVTAGTYKSVTVNAKGHITAGTNPTTLSGYGITNAYTKTEVDTIANGKAASSHNHAASNITSGTLSSDRLPTVPIAKGGTGATTAAAVLTNLGITATATELNKLDGITATTTELNYVDGVTSNIQTQLDGKLSTSTKYAGSSSVGGSATSAVKLDTSTAGDANTPVYFSGGKPVACTSLDLNTSGSSASCTGNSATATKLKATKNIGLGTGVISTATAFDGSANITIPVTEIKESYLSWGGKNLSGSVSPIDAACSNIHSANRFAFAKAAGITIEYSTNGSTYSVYNTTDSAKINLVSGNGNTYYIGARSTSTTVNDKLRIILNATNMGLYTRLRKLLINISTSYATGSNVVIEKAMKGSETTFSTIGTYQISGWSGWNSIPINSAFGGGSNQTENIAVLRLTFGITGVNAEQTSNALSVSDIIGIGDTYWSFPSTMAKTGHIYTYDSSQNTTFPAKVTATTFVGALSGNATTATTANNVAWSGVTSKPSYYDAKAIKSITRSGTTFTYTCMDGTTGTFTQQDNNTTYNAVTTSANGLMIASDKVKLDAMELATLAEVKTYLGI